MSSEKFSGDIFLKFLFDTEIQHRSIVTRIQVYFDFGDNSVTICDNYVKFL